MKTRNLFFALLLCLGSPASRAESLPSMPEAVTSFGAATHGGWLYVFGGYRGERHEYNSNEVSGAFHRLKLSGGAAWERLPGAEPTQGAALVAHGNYLYRVGGMAAQNAKGEKQNLLSKDVAARFSVAGQRWEALPALPAPRSSHDAASAQDVLFVGGGWRLPGGTNKSVWHDTLLMLDLSGAASAWKSVPQPFKRRALAMAAQGSTVYFLGGMEAAGKTSLAVDIYDAKTGAWSKGPDLPDERMKGFGCSAVAWNGRIYSSGMKGDLHRLSADGSRWEPAGKLQHSRFFHRLVVAGPNLLAAIGGEDSEGKRNDVELIDLSAAPETLKAKSE